MTGDRRLVLGGTYCFLWFMSIYCGFLTLCCPCLILLFIHQKTYRFALDTIFAIWELYPVGLMEVMFGVETIILGDRIRPWERSVLVMNHRTRLDWNFLWAAMHYAASTPAHRLKFVLKAPIRHCPGPGWVMQMAGFFYIYRDWSKDKRLLSRMVDYYKDLDHTYQVLLFPEGTDLTPFSLTRSNSYADKNNLPYYTRVLHPRTTGFSFLVEKMRTCNQLDAVYDLTVGYTSAIPQSELDLIRGIFPKKIHFYIKRYGCDELPNTEDGLKIWLSEIWNTKENLLSQFYSEGNFGPCLPAGPWPRPISNSLYLAVVGWTGLVVCTLLLIATSDYFRMYVLCSNLLFVLLSLSTDGLQHLEIYWFRAKKYILPNSKKAD